MDRSAVGVTVGAGRTVGDGGGRVGVGVAVDTVGTGEGVAVGEAVGEGIIWVGAAWAAAGGSSWPGSRTTKLQPAVRPRISPLNNMNLKVKNWLFFIMVIVPIQIALSQISAAIFQPMD